MRRSITLLTLAFICSFSLTAQPPGQDKAQLEKERQLIQRELNEIQGLYNKVKGQTKQTLGQLNVLQRKINLQEQYISSINKEIRTIDDDIYLANLEIYRLSNQLDTLKSQYAKTVVYAYKNRSNYDFLNFIFSATSFNDAIRRIAYLKSYRNYREKQMNIILETQDLIAKRQQQQLKRKDQKNAALDNQTKQFESLAVQRKEKDEVIRQLKTKEKDLQGQIAAKKKKDRDLQNAITAIVRREIEAAKEAAKKEAEARARREAEEKKRLAEANKTTSPTTTPTTTSTAGTGTKTETEKKSESSEDLNTSRTSLTSRPDSYLDLNATDVALNNKFELNKAKLPWPVDNGVMTLRFGTNKIDNTLLTFDNPGITITTPAPGVPVKAVFDGEVSGIHNLGDAMAVTIRHGKYFTTYSNLSSVTVSKGVQVKTGQAIGKAGRDDDSNGGQVDFILMIETRNVDPYPWLRR